MFGRVRRLLGRLLSWLRPEEEDGGGDGSGSIWNLTPAWQYTGLHVESGGTTIDTQERALRDIQEEAERRAPEERDRTRGRS